MHAPTLSGDEVETAAGPPRDTLRFRLLLGAELILAAVTGFLFLGRPSLWLDEATSVTLTTGSWSELFDIISSTEAMHGFYYVVLKLWIPIAGTGEFAIRTPSVAFFVVSVLMLALLGRTLFSDRTGLMAGLLLTLNPFMLVFAREARSYAMVTMFVTMLMLLFVGLMLAKSLNPPYLALYTIVGVLAVYAHAWAIFVLVVQAGAVVAVKTFRPKLPWMAASWVAMAIVASPLLYFFIAREGNQVSWIPPVGISELVHHFARHAGGWLLMVLYLILALVALGTHFFGDRGRRTWDIGIITAWILVPPVLTFVLSFWVPLFVSRYLIVSLPALVLLVAVGVNAVKPKMLGYGLLAAVLLLSIFRNGPAYTSNVEDWRAATDFVVDSAEPGDVIVFYAPYVRKPFEYYQEREASTGSPEVIRYELTGDDLSTSTVDTLIQAVAEGGERRVWVVLSHDIAGEGPSIERELIAIRRLESRTEFDGSIRVILLAPDEK